MTPDEPASPDFRSAPITVLEEFAAVIAHELNTPLAIIRMASDAVLATEGDGPRQRELLEMIRRNTDLALLLVRRLSLAREIEAESVELSLEDVDIGGLVRESVGDLEQVLLHGRPVDVVIDPCPPVRADATAAREIVFNLLSNAVKYSELDAPIEIAVGTEDADVWVCVRDHGSGVDPAESERIFGKFVQGEEATQGSGLGLYISRGLARAHGGDIVVHPAQRSGSEFRLTLPLG